MCYYSELFDNLTNNLYWAYYKDFGTNNYDILSNDNIKTEVEDIVLVEDYIIKEQIIEYIDIYNYYKKNIYGENIVNILYKDKIKVDNYETTLEKLTRELKEIDKLVVEQSVEDTVVDEERLNSKSTKKNSEREEDVKKVDDGKQFDFVGYRKKLSYPITQQFKYYNENVIDMFTNLDNVEIETEPLFPLGLIFLFSYHFIYTLLGGLYLRIPSMTSYEGEYFIFVNLVVPQFETLYYYLAHILVFDIILIIIMKKILDMMKRSLLYSNISLIEFLCYVILIHYMNIIVYFRMY